jgi:hypothetical protein
VQVAKHGPWPQDKVPPPHEFVPVHFMVHGADTGHCTVASWHAARPLQTTAQGASLGQTMEVSSQVAVAPHDTWHGKPAGQTIEEDPQVDNVSHAMRHVPPLHPPEQAGGHASAILVLPSALEESPLSAAAPPSVALPTSDALPSSIVSGCSDASLPPQDASAIESTQTCRMKLHASMLVTHLSRQVETANGSHDAHGVARRVA